MAISNDEALNEAITNIKHANADLARAFAERDMAHVAGLYTLDARLLPPGSPIIEGRPAIEHAWKQAAHLVKSFTLATVDVELFGELAHETGRLILYGLDGSIAAEGKYLVVWKKFDGAWLIHRDCWNTN